MPILLPGKISARALPCLIHALSIAAGQEILCARKVLTPAPYGPMHQHLDICCTPASALVVPADTALTLQAAT